MQITLIQFEKIDSLLSAVLRMGAFETCADPRGYIQTSNRLFDACVDAMGYAWTDDFACPLEAGAAVVAHALLNPNFVADEVA